MVKPGWLYPPDHKKGTFLVISPGFEKIVAERIRKGELRG